MATVIKTTFQFRRGNSAEWEEINPILNAGEPGFAIDLGNFKIGDGVTPWNELEYMKNSGVFNADTHYDFPSVGTVNVIYKAEKEKKIYQWNPTSLVYESLSDGGEISDIDDVEVIYGGSASGTT